MKVSNMSSPYLGVRSGLDSLNERSERLSDANNHDKIADLATLPQDVKQVQSSAKSLKSENDRIGTLLDIMA
jgi:hypothetical protein